jgi:hypothetical protein
MIQAAFFGVFDYVAKNQWAQIVVGIGVFYFGLKMRDRWRDRTTKKRVEARIEKKSRRVQQTIREEQHEKSKQVADARAAAPRGITAADGVSDEYAGLIFSD